MGGCRGGGAGPGTDRAKRVPQCPSESLRPGSPCRLSRPRCWGQGGASVSPGITETLPAMEARPCCSLGAERGGGRGQGSCCPKMPRKQTLSLPSL